MPRAANSFLRARSRTTGSDRPSARPSVARLMTGGSSRSSALLSGWQGSGGRVPRWCPRPRGPVRTADRPHDGGAWPNPATRTHPQLRRLATFLPHRRGHRRTVQVPPGTRTGRPPGRGYVAYTLWRATRRRGLTLVGRGSELGAAIRRQLRLDAVRRCDRARPRSSDVRQRPRSAVLLS